MPTPFLAIAVAWATIMASPPSLDPVAIEQRMLQLRLRIETEKAAKNWDGVTAIIREMATLDPEHPKVYLEAVLVQERRGKPGEGAALMDSLGLPHGPGRSYGQGVTSVIQRRLDEAVRSFSKALTGYRSLGHLAGQAACHTGLGIVAKGRSDLNESVKQYEAAQRLLDKIQDLQGSSDVLHEMADLEMRRGRPALALRRHRQALAVRETLGDRAAQAQSWHGIGTSSIAMGDRTEAIDAFDRALTIRRELQDWKGEISTLEGLATVYQAEDLDKAMRILGDALRVAEGVPDSRSRADVLRVQGDALLDAGRNREAVPLLDTAASLYRELKDAAGEAAALGRLGLALNRCGEFGRSRVILEKALEQSRATMSRAVEAAALTDLGNTALATGEPARALLHYERSMELHREIKDRVGELQALNNLYATYFYMGMLDLSRHYLEQALEGFEALHDKGGTARARSNLGVLLAEENRPGEGLVQLERAIRIRRDLKDSRGTAISCASAAEISLRLDKRADASRLVNEALEAARKIGDRGTEAYALNVLGHVQLAEGNTGAALESHRRALLIATDSDLAEERWRAHAGIASGLEREGKAAAALEETLRAVDEIEGIRGGLIVGEFKMRYLAGKIDLYEDALLRLVPPGTDRADIKIVTTSFQLAERARARSLLDVLAESRSRVREKLPAELQRREQEVLDELSSASMQLAGSGTVEEQETARRQVSVARARLSELEIEIHRSAPRYAGLLYPRPASLEEVQSHILGDGEVLLEYFVGARRAWLWIVDKQSASIRDLGPSDEIARRVDAFLKEAAFAGSDLTGKPRDIDAARRLASAVLPPDAVFPAKRIVVVADGSLHSIPFETLRPDGRFLVEDHEVVVVPSAAVLGLMRSAPAPMAPGGFLGVGDPILGTTGIKDAGLPYSRLELEAAGETFAEDQRTILTGADATRSSLKSLALDKFRFIHFATHGWIDAADLRHSGLRLSAAADGERAGLLSADEILSLPLASEVVVLSSCRSGVGERLAGEGSVGLARAFLYAGAHSVLVSLWDVGDRSTASFMSSLYGRLQRGEAASEALRHVKLEFLTSDQPARRQIHVWAPFVLVGDPGDTVRRSSRPDQSPTK